MTRVLAHRGDARHARENTLDAFAAAIAAGADGVELDVRRTADGALVVHHDADLTGLGPVAAASLRALPGWVPTLEDALGVLEGAYVNVEVKNDPREPGHDASGSLSHDVAAVVAELVADLDRVVVSSFDVPTLDAVREADPRLATGLLLGYEAEPLLGVGVALAHGCRALHPFVLHVDTHLVAIARGAGLELNTWTVNARHDLERVLALGVDAVIVDDVPLALEVRAQLAGLAEALPPPLE